MQTPRDMLAELWANLGGDRTALDLLALTGAEPALPHIRLDRALQFLIGDRLQ